MKKRKLGIIICFSLVAIIVVAYIISLNVKINKAYEVACDYLANGEYSKAIEEFEALGDYKDSETMIYEAKYQDAESKYCSKLYEEALSIFISLGDYKDSEQRVKEIIEKINEEEAVSIIRKIGIDVPTNHYIEYQQKVERDVETYYLITLDIHKDNTITLNSTLYKKDGSGEAAGRITSYAKYWEEAVEWDESKNKYIINDDTGNVECILDISKESVSLELIDEELTYFNGTYFYSGIEEE